MLNPSVGTIADAYWDSHFGCPTHTLFAAPLSIQIHGGDLADYWGAFALFWHGAAIVSLPSTCADKLKGLLATAVSDCSPASVAKALASVASVVIAPASIGYATAVSAAQRRTMLRQKRLGCRLASCWLYMRVGQTTVGWT
jgi:hypothetical protein